LNVIPPFENTRYGCTLAALHLVRALHLVPVFADWNLEEKKTTTLEMEKLN